MNEIRKINQYINKNDIVSIHWEYIDAEFDIEILYIPVDPGDSWHLKRSDGTIVYVNNFCKMVKQSQRGEG